MSAGPQTVRNERVAWAERDVSSVSRIATLWLPPIVAFLLMRVLLVRAARFAGVDGWAAASWGRWDSAHYFAIAEGGYELFSCSQLPGYDPTQTCGNAAWLPAYPLLIRMFSAFGVSSASSGAFIAACFAFATLVILWRWHLGARITLGSVALLTFAAVFPGAVYQHASFPVSLCTFCNIVALHAYTRRQFLLAGVFGALAAFSYSSGVFLVAVFGTHAMWTFIAERRWDHLRSAVGTCALTGSGFLAVLLWHQLQLGHWNAYMLVQTKYHYEFTAPWTRLAEIVSSMFEPTASATSIQTCFVALLAVSLIAASWKQRADRVTQLLTVFLLVYWLVPLTLGNGYVATYRAEAMLLPAVSLARRFPRPVLLFAVAIAFILAQRVGVLFFRNALA